ncbi:MAG: prepilin-type N-terminal cleavage/methylation domain-containing protein [bacterium]
MKYFGKIERVRYGFTLIELLIVVAIIGILAAIAVPNFRKAQHRAMISRGQADMRSVVQAYRMYLLDGNDWPAHSDAPDAMNALTTPVAYVNSPIWDVFTLNDPQNKGLKKDKMIHGCLPHFEGGCGWFKATIDGKHLAKYQESDRMLFLHGPNGYGAIYQPSNGTFSHGGLWYMMTLDGKPRWGDI